MIDPNLRKAFRFHFRADGYIVGARADCCLALARAEIAARDRDWKFVWEYDKYYGPCDDEGCSDYIREQAGYDRDGNLEMHAHNTGGHEHEVLWCAVYETDNDGERVGYPLASLGGIIDPSNDYRRVIEAELAMEALADEARAASDLLRFVSGAYGVAVAS